MADRVMRPRIIYVLPMGPLGEEDLKWIAESVTEQFGLPVGIMPNFGPPSFALNAARRQYNSNAILKKLLEICPPDGLKILAVTPYDLFSPIFAYVFGEAQFGGRCTVISSFRLKGDFDGKQVHGCPSVISRLEKEAIHELGHTFGLRHCSDPDCVMQYSTGLQCADRKFAFFCSACRDLMLWNLANDLFLRA